MFPPNAIPTAITQGTWHTLRAVVSPTRQVVYVDGVLVSAGENLTGGNSAQPPGPGSSGNVDWAIIAAVGLVDFRNVKVWTRPFPA